MNITKADIAESLIKNVGLNKTDAKKIVDSFFEEIALALERGEELKISGLGKFVLKAKAERPGRNPKTGEEYTISARRVVTFKKGQKLKKITKKEENSFGA